MKKALLSILAVVALMAVSTVGRAQTAYTMITSASGLEAGAQYLIVGYDNDGQAYAMSYQKSNNRHAVTIEVVNGVVTATVATSTSSQTEPYEFILGGSAGQWTFEDPLNDGYLYAPGGGNYLRTQGTLSDQGKWAIEDLGDGAFKPVSNGGAEQNIMRYNVTSTLFGCYKETSNVTDPVYFFKQGGSVQIDPEPENYPTEFGVDPNGIDVMLYWTDPEPTPVGYLPRAYVVLGSTGNITVPVDGTPVANDMDASDGTLACNVMYGIQECIFESLPGNTTWHFAIFPYTNSGTNIDYKTDGNYPTANYTTEDYEVLLSESFEGGSLGAFTAYDVIGDQEWTVATYNNNSYAYMNGYASGSAHENEDWLISPMLDGEYDVINLSFRTAMNFTGDALRVMISNDYDGNGNPNNKAEWIDLSSHFVWSDGGYNWEYSGEVDIAEFVRPSFYLAFVYTCTDEGAAAWEVDDVNMIGIGYTGVGEVSGNSFVVAPNPANDQIRFTLDQSAQVSVYDLSGRMVSDNTMSAGENTLDVVRLESGVYFLNVRYMDGTKVVSRFVKY